MLFELIQGQEHIQSETLKPALIIRGSTARARIKAPRKEVMLLEKMSM
jgi:hypothetical protein